MDNKPKVFVIGHSHIDTVWLWDREATYEICRKTFSAVVELVKKYPDFIYAQSGAQHYEWMEEKHPELFEKIKEEVKNGHIEPVGGMWVEPDCNIPSGESLVRQFLYGKGYFKKKFNKDVRVAWLPDTFGFPYTMPQIFKKCGIDYFMTAKLRHQTYRPFPHYAFWWESPDSSRVLGVQLIGGYSQWFTDAVKEELWLMQNKKKPKMNSLFLFWGIGDHGEGITDELLANMKKYIEDNPDVDIGYSTAQNFYETLEKEAKGKKVPLIKDELYLKSHQGTFTSLSRMKKYNRDTEILLDNIERLSVMSETAYPRKELDSYWKTLLFSQFHDSLAGTSIPKVYEDWDKDFKAISGNGAKLLSKAAAAISDNIDTRGMGKALVIFNQLSWKRDDVVFVRQKGEATITDPAGKEVLSQKTKDGLIFEAHSVPSMGYSQYRIIKKENNERQKSGIKITPYTMENKFYKLSIDPRSCFIKGIYDKLNKKEAFSANAAVLQVHEDYSVTEEESAWNIHPGRIYEIKKSGTPKVIEKGPVRIKLEMKYSFREKGSRDSAAIMRICLYRNIPRIDFSVELNWHSKHKMLKVAFPVNAKNYRTAYEIPFGCIERADPTSPIADSDMRDRTEVPGHKWADHSDSDYGLCLANNSKYGYDSKNNTLRMTLLRTPIYPIGGWPWQRGIGKEIPMDLGRHKIKFSIYPHKGTWKNINAPQKGYEVNYPLIPFMAANHAGSPAKNKSTMDIASRNIIIAAVKKAEDSDAKVIRLYETMGKNTNAELKTASQIKDAWETDMLENNTSRLVVKNNSVKLKFTPYEIKTIKINPFN